MGSANELHLDAFREHPEFASFRGRLELVRAPYLRSYEQERPSTTRTSRRRCAATSRRTRPRWPRCSPSSRACASPTPTATRARVGAIVSTLTGDREGGPLRARAARPSASTPTRQKLLRAAIKEIYDESDAYPIYEGRIGASPREMRVVLLDAAQSHGVQVPHRRSPCSTRSTRSASARTSSSGSSRTPIAGGYHDVKTFRETLAGAPARGVGGRALRRERPRRRGAVRRALRALRAARERLGEEGADPQPGHAASTRSPTRR